MLQERVFLIVLALKKMVNQQLISYIENQLRKGFQPQQVRTYLVNYGYNANDVDESLRTAATTRMDSLSLYIKGELEKGEQPHLLRTKLIQYGYQAEEVDTAMGSTQKKPIGAIIFLVFVALIVVGLVWFFAFREVPPSYNDYKPHSRTVVDVPDEPEIDEPEIDEPEVVEPEPDVPNKSVVNELEPDIPDNSEVVEPEPVKPDKTETPKIIAPARLGGKYDEETIKVTADNCGKITNEVRKDACFAQVSKAAKDEEYCEPIVRDKTRDDCYMRVVIELENYAICDKIVDEQVKDFCKDIPE